MPTDAHASRRPSFTTLALVVVTAGVSVVAAATTPFTAAADLVVSVCLGLLVVVVVAQALGPTGRWWSRRAPPRGQRPTLAAAAPWLALVALVVAYELVNVVAGPRSAHPTLSSMYDALARWRAAKAAAFFAWLALGWYLVRR